MATRMLMSLSLRNWRKFSFSCYEFFFFRGIFLLSVVSFRFFTQHGGENNGELSFFFGPIAACYRNLFGRLSGYSAWLVNELAFGVWLVAGGTPWIRLFCISFGLCGRWMVTNRTGEVADLFGGGWLTDQRWAFSF